MNTVILSYDDIILIQDYNYVFDLLDYFYTTRDDCKILENDEYYDNIIEEYNESSTEESYDNDYDY